MGYEVDDAQRRQRDQLPMSKEQRSWGLAAMGTALFGLCVPAGIAYVIFPVALIVTIFGTNKGSRLAQWAWLPLALLGVSLIYTTFTIQAALGG